MAAIPVVSSWIASIEYDAEKHELKVVLDNGEDCTYRQVPVEVYRAFLNAPSAGSFFIKQVKYRFPESKG